MNPEPNFAAFPARALTNECKCIHGIPLSVPIPGEGEICPYLGERRGSYYDLLDQGILCRFKTRGLKEGASTVYGPSVCDAKFGCRCGLRHRLAELRAARKRAEGKNQAASEPSPTSPTTPSSSEVPS